jgi:MFS family permease
VSRSPSFPPTLRALQRRTIRVLVVAQLLGACGLAAGGTAGALLAEQLTGSPATAGLPLAMLVLGSGIGAVAVTHIMSGRGRRAGLSVAYLAGGAGAGLVVAAVAWGSWPLLLAGCGLLGGGNAAVMLARYAAADLSSRRARSISAVVAAASVGAVAGPNLLGSAGVLAGAVGLPAPTGLFLLAIPAFLAAALVLLVFLRPDPLQVARSAAAPSTDQPAVTGGWGELVALLGDRHIRLALVMLAVANLAMVGDGGGAGTPARRRRRHGRDRAADQRPHRRYVPAIAGDRMDGRHARAPRGGRHGAAPAAGRWRHRRHSGLRPSGDRGGAAAARGRMERWPDRRQRAAP